VTNKASEVFVHGGKPGSDADAMQYDAGVLVSLLLQHGASPADIRRSLCEREDGSPATVAGAIIEVVANAG
jgi:hypothetical protein